MTGVTSGRLTVPDRKRQQRRQAERDAVRQGVGDVYIDLARLEATRTELVAAALAAVEAHRAARAALCSAEAALAEAVLCLVDLGMAVPDVAATVGLDESEVRQIQATPRVRANARRAES
jgi:hypothetical protein